jgi:hypothetical protein
MMRKYNTIIITPVFTIKTSVWIRTLSVYCLLARPTVLTEIKILLQFEYMDVVYHKKLEVSSGV